MAMNGMDQMAGGVGGGASEPVADDAAGMEEHMVTCPKCGAEFDANENEAEEAAAPVAPVAPPKQTLKQQLAGKLRAGGLME